MYDNNKFLNIDEDNEDELKYSNIWLTIFCDLSLLLLTFFILLFSMSTIDKQRFNESFSAIRDTFGGDKQKTITLEQQNIEQQALDLLALQQEILIAQTNAFNSIKTFIEQNSLGEDIHALFNDNIITLRLPSDIIFDSGSEQLNPQGIEILKKMRDFFLKNRQLYINIKGYTDNSPVSPGSRYKDNWELSALRSVNVLRQLLQDGIEATRMTATGLGDLEPLVPNDTPKNKTLNRRVEFSLEQKIGELKK